jgi:ABC-type glycerol-3-phosphate transport system permease component
MGALRGPKVRSEKSKVESSKGHSIFFYFLLLTCAVFFLFPFMWMLSTALKPGHLLFVEPPVWFIWPPAWNNFVEAWNSAGFGRYGVNSMWVAGVTIIGTVGSSSLAGFAFATLPARGKRLWFGLLLATMMVPAWATLIPSFLLFSRLGLTDSYLPFVLPAFCAPAVYVFLFRQSFLGLPPQLLDAAEVDGATPLQSYWHIALPLSKPVLATVAVFAFIGAWNDFLNPLIYLRSLEKYTLALGLSFLNGPNFQRLHWQMAMSLVALAPVVVIVLVAQKLVVNSFDVGGIHL